MLRVLPDGQNVVLAGENRQLSSVKSGVRPFDDSQHNKERFAIFIYLWTLMPMPRVLHCKFVQPELLLKGVQFSRVGIPDRNPNEALWPTNVVTDLA
jgi:hypothetical protein